MSQLLVLSIYFIPFLLQSFTELVYLILGQAVFMDLVLLVQISNHLVFVIDILFYLVDISWSLAVILFLCPVHWLRGSFVNRKDVLDGIRNNKVFSRFQSLDWFLMNAWDWRFLVLAVIGEILGNWELLITHRTRFRF